MTKITFTGFFVIIIVFFDMSTPIAITNRYSTKKQEFVYYLSIVFSKQYLFITIIPLIKTFCSCPSANENEKLFQVF